MKCIKCGSDTQVINSRPRVKTASIWRRRTCKGCGLTFTTEETVSEADFQITIRAESGHKRPFSFARLLMSIYDAMPVREAENAPDDAYWLATTIAQTIQQNGRDELGANDLAALAYDTLSRFDAALGMNYGVKHRVLSLTRQPKRGRPRTKRRA